MTHHPELAQGLVEQLRQMNDFLLDVWRRNAALRGVTLDLGYTLEGFVLAHGVGRFGARLPKGMRKLKNKLCYQHATHLMLTDEERFLYCEGYAVRPSLGFATGTHAWVLDRARDWAVVDNTWADPAECVYLGVPLSRSYVGDTLTRKRTYGVLDNWEEGFPILKADPAAFLHPAAGEIPRDFPG
jgi:hypothetical protein